MNAPLIIDKQLIAHDFHVAMHGKLEPEKIYDVTKTLVASRKSYPAKAAWPA
ncbi:hypothetical protein [Halomonas sp. BC04]|uniref:hypothetical protein n=1 Tax=Halomonas sp. BC04 TaxID=1403540 RepID=UPI0003ED5FCD|nr:hypothetical protein [Halomonas sp. BC04]EWG97887.1 hypothetical protein Q427_33575 [Halomonas sp. BC04]